MAVAIPHAFDSGMSAVVFVMAYVSIQVGRTLFVLLLLGANNKLTPNFQRILAWLCFAACFWIAGVVYEEYRLLFWIVAVCCEYFSPMIGFRFPGLGVSKTSDWSINGEHLSERCQLLVIVALGESILLTGATIAHVDQATIYTYAAFICAFLSSLVMWWIYFDTASKDGAEVITESSDPGKIGAYYHYVHIIIIFGLIITAVASDLLIAHPEDGLKIKYMLIVTGGPLIYILGNGLFKSVIYGRFPLSHIIGIIMMAIVSLITFNTNFLYLGLGILTSLLLVAIWETRHHRKRQN
jgi:low temperature requirement protein LtrA